jgi:predicted transcriptional regulator of viral defense system
MPISDRLPEECLELLAVQHGVISRRQALEGGMSVTQIRRRLRNGRWKQLHQGVYAAFTGEPTRLALIWSALLAAGPGAAASHDTAAELYRLGRSRAEAIHVTIPAVRTMQRAHDFGPQALPRLVVHRSDRILRACHPVLLPPRTRIEETVIDLTQSATTFEDAFGWLCQACADRRCTASMLRRALDQRKKARYRQELHAALADVADGVHSQLEYRYVHGVERPHGLPAARRQALVTLETRRRYLDNLYQEYLLAVELDGKAAHSVGERWRDTQRDRSLARLGVMTLRYNWSDVTSRPCETAAEIAEILTQRGWPGPLRPCNPTCPAPGLRAPTPHLPAPTPRLRGAAPPP